MDDWLDYWFDMHVEGDTRRLQTYAYGWLLDERSSDAKSWGEMITEVAPLIQADIDQYGVAS